MRAACIVGLVLSLSVVVLAQPADVMFDDDISRVMVNKEWRDAKVKVDLTVTMQASGLVIAAKKKSKLMPEPLTIAYEDIASLSYDRRSRMRVMAPNYGKALDHWLTIQFKNAGVGDFIEIELGKNVASEVVNTLEARSGKKAERTAG